MADNPVRLAYADPPYPGMAGLYPENTEVDHPALIAELIEYDGWALSTDERSLAYVLPLCPEGTRVLAWCRPNAPPFRPNPYASWEPVLCKPARTKRCDAASYFVAGAPTGFRQVAGLTGWAGVGGRVRPDLASPREQLYRAWLVWERDGYSWREWGTARACGLR